MEKRESARRDFIKRSAMGVGGLAMTPLAIPLENKSEAIDVQKKLNIVCVGAHPGDPEFGCGGTMAKYSDAGHAVTFLYLTRGEASDPSTSHKEMAAARTKEAEVSSAILKVRTKFVGQIDGATILDRNSNVTFEKLLLEERPDLVFSQWPIDAHADHQVAGMLALTAWINSGSRFHLYFY
jgi:LmbE family N-acetylglucosaminyl deacetylase